MKLNSTQDSKKVTFRPIMIYIMLFAISISFLNGIFRKEFSPQLFILLISGFGFGTLLTYYVMNHQSFESMLFDKFVLAMFLNMIVSRVIALATLYLIN